MAPFLFCHFEDFFSVIASMAYFAMRGDLFIELPRQRKTRLPREGICDPHNDRLGTPFIALWRSRVFSTM